MKIKITGCSIDRYWYASKIGEVFEVAREEESTYMVGEDDQPYSWVKKTDCIPYKEKEVTKTKRVAVIWFGDVPESTDYVDIRARQHGNEWDKGRQIKACVIDRDRITIKERMDGEVVYSVSPPKPETVEDVLNDLYEFNGMNENEIDDFKGRIKAAQDREL